MLESLNISVLTVCNKHFLEQIFHDTCRENKISISEVYFVISQKCLGHKLVSDFSSHGRNLLSKKGSGGLVCYVVKVHDPFCDQTLTMN